MLTFKALLVLVMIAAAITAGLLRNLLAVVIVFTVYSLMMALLWQQLNAPDLAITEAALGAGVTSILFILALRQMRRHTP